MPWHDTEYLADSKERTLTLITPEMRSDLRRMQSSARRVIKAVSGEFQAMVRQGYRVVERAGEGLFMGRESNPQYTEGPQNWDLRHIHFSSGMEAQATAKLLKRAGYKAEIQVNPGYGYGYYKVVKSWTLMTDATNDVVFILDKFLKRQLTDWEERQFPEYYRLLSERLGYDLRDKQDQTAGEIGRGGVVKGKALKGRESNPEYNVLNKAQFDALKQLNRAYPKGDVFLGEIKLARGESLSDALAAVERLNESTGVGHDVVQFQGKYYSAPDAWVSKVLVDTRMERRAEREVERASSLRTKPRAGGGIRGALRAGWDELVSNPGYKQSGEWLGHGASDYSQPIYRMGDKYYYAFLIAHEGRYRVHGKLLAEGRDAEGYDWDRTRKSMVSSAIVLDIPYGIHSREVIIDSDKAMPVIDSWEAKPRTVPKSQTHEYRGYYLKQMDVGSGKKVYVFETLEALEAADGARGEIDLEFFQSSKTLADAKARIDGYISDYGERQSNPGAGQFRVKVYRGYTWDDATRLKNLLEAIGVVAILDPVGFRGQVDVLVKMNSPKIRAIVENHKRDRQSNPGLPPGGDWINTTGDVVAGDVIQFSEAVFGGSHWSPKYLGDRKVVARVVKDSYGKDRQQHTFTLEVISSTGTQPLEPGTTTRRKGRNVYKQGTERTHWSDEAQRGAAADEKHSRGDSARAVRSARRGNPGSSNPDPNDATTLGHYLINKRGAVFHGTPDNATSIYKLPDSRVVESSWDGWRVLRDGDVESTGIGLRALNDYLVNEPGRLAAKSQTEALEREKAKEQAAADKKKRAIRDFIEKIRAGIERAHGSASVSVLPHAYPPTMRIKSGEGHVTVDVELGSGEYWTYGLGSGLQPAKLFKHLAKYGDWE